MYQDPLFKKGRYKDQGGVARIARLLKKGAVFESRVFGSLGVVPLSFCWCVVGGKADVICGHENALVTQAANARPFFIGLHHHLNSVIR
jgi:hypothetical protein